MFALPQCHFNHEYTDLSRKNNTKKAKVYFNAHLLKLHLGLKNSQLN